MLSDMQFGQPFIFDRNFRAFKIQTEHMMKSRAVTELRISYIAAYLTMLPSHRFLKLSNFSLKNNPQRSQSLLQLQLSHGGCCLFTPPQIHHRFLLDPLKDK